MFKIVAISDTHGSHKELDLPLGDVIVHCGDYSPTGSLEDILEVAKWLESLDYKHKICVSGNHDAEAEQRPRLTKDIFKDSGVAYLDNAEFVIDGVKFWGSPITPAFMNWHFMRDRGDNIAMIWKQIPNDTDVLITHGPPLNILDENHRHQHCGCWDLNDKIRKVKPKVHLFGHIHESYGAYTHADGVRHYNCAVMNEWYDVVNKATEVEL